MPFQPRYPRYSPPVRRNRKKKKKKRQSPLRPRGLRSRGPAVLAEAEPAGQSTVAEGPVVAEQAEEVTERAAVEISSQMRVSIQLAAFSAQERVEV